MTHVQINAVSVVILLAFTAVGGVILRYGDRQPPIPLGVMLSSSAGIAMPAPKIAQQWERAVVLRLGKFVGLRGPGLFWIIPFVDTSRRGLTSAVIRPLSPQRKP